MTVILLSLSGITMLFLISFEPTGPQDKSEMSQTGIPKSLSNLLIGTQSEINLVETEKLDSCLTANMIIGKNGIAQCEN